MKLGDTMWLSLFILALTLSIDAFGIGVAYTVKGVEIPFSSKLFIGFISAVIMWGAALLGEVMMRYLPEWSTRYFGLLILFLMGGVFIKNGLCGSEGETYDLDASKQIDGVESILLAIALSADSISVGLAAATLGMSWFFLGILTGILQMMFLWVGVLLLRKRRLLSLLDCRSSSMLSGVMLILIGIIKLFQ